MHSPCRPSIGLLMILATFMSTAALSAFIPSSPTSISSIATTTRRSRSNTARPSISLDSFFGRRPPRPTTTTVPSPPATSIPISEVSRQDLRLAASVCIESFFGTADRLNPVRSMQLATLLDEQFADLRSRFGGRAVGGSVYLQAVDADGAMVGFVEVGITQSLKYGMEQYGVPVRDERPYLANLSVRPASRRQGVGRRLVHACEEMVRSWGYDELILQVEDSNQHARNLYRDMGYIDLYTDATGRKYELSGMSIKNVRINKVTLRKALVPSAAKNPFAALWGQLSISQG